MQKLKDNEPRPKFTGSYKKKCVVRQPRELAYIINVRTVQCWKVVNIQLELSRLTVSERRNINRCVLIRD